MSKQSDYVTELTLEILHHHIKQALFPVPAILASISFFRSRVLNNAAGLRARPREEKSFSKRERLKLNFTSFCEVIFVNIPKDNQCLRFRLLTFTTVGSVTKKILLLDVTLLLGKPIHRDTLI